MNWNRILANVAGSILTAIGVTIAGPGVPTDASSWWHFFVTTIGAVGLNQAGLFQRSPKAPKAT